MSIPRLPHQRGGGGSGYETPPEASAQPKNTSPLISQQLLPQSPGPQTPLPETEGLSGAEAALCSGLAGRETGSSQVNKYLASALVWVLFFFFLLSKLLLVAASARS